MDDEPDLRAEARAAAQHRNRELRLDEHARAHACPICGRPALGGPRYPHAVCDGCKPKTVCSHGQVVHGHNVSFSGGFAGVHSADDSPCDQLTADGRCWIDGQLCDMREARFGGVVVSAVTGAGPVEQPGRGRR